MKNTSVRSAEEVENIVHNYGDMLFRISLVMLGNEKDAEDAVQDTVLKYIQKAPCFECEEHKKAWLIKVISNHCRDMKRFVFRHPQINIDDVQHYTSTPESCGIIEALMTLQPKFRIVMLLYYVEEYKMEDIALIIGKSVSAVKMRLQKGRKLLEEAYRKEYL